VWFWLSDEGGCLRLVFRSLSWIEVQENLLRNVLKEAKILSKGWFWWLIKGDDEKFKSLENGHKLFSKCVVWLIYMWVLLACISWKSTLIFGNSEKLQQSIEVTRWIIQRRIVILCKTFEAITRGGGYVLSSYFYVLLSGGVVSRTLNYVICEGWGIYVTECKHEFEFMWKSNVVMGLCDLKNLRRREKASGLKREIKMIWPLRNLKPFFDEECNVLCGYWIEFRWSLAHASVKF
jgi:hypothetical protein